MLKNRHHIVTPNSFFQLKYKELLKMVYFFLPHIILGVSKNHNLGNKKCVTLGDALTSTIPGRSLLRHSI